jgi:hypothetical protein
MAAFVLCVDTLFSFLHVQYDKMCIVKFLVTSMYEH